jgi:hypothetical protein
MRKRVRIFLAVIGVWSSICLAEPTSQPTQDVRKGAFHINFTEQSPLSPIEAQNKRYHIKITADEKYDLSQESFEAIVPEDYDPQRPSGLFVWINAAESGSVPQDWPAILAKQHLICIGANNSGNPRPIAIRAGLALDAVHNIKKIYNIDDSRVYIVGISGGAKVAAMVGVVYPDVFSGALPMVGVSYFRNLDVPGDPTRIYPSMFERPATPIFERAKLRSRFVFITGTYDMNHDPIKNTYQQGFLADGFVHADFVEVPGMGHQPADAQVLDQAIQTLDAPLVTDAPKNFEQAQAFEKAGKISQARPLYAEVALHGPARLAEEAQQRLMDLPIVVEDVPTTAPSQPITVSEKKDATAASSDAVSDTEEREAQSWYSLAENYQRNHLLDQARQRLERILKEHPNTQAAAKARQLLERIKSEQ